MKKDSLIYKYHKIVKSDKKLSDSSKKKIRNNFVTKLFLRIFLSTFILLCLVIIDKVSISVQNVKLSENTIRKNLNFLKMVTLFNGMFGEFIIIDDDLNVDSSNLYDQVRYQNNINYVVNDNFSGVVSSASGVVTKIIKHNDDTYAITLEASDGFEYTYDGLITIDFSIYNYIGKGTIIGLAKTQDEKYTFELIIKKDGKYYDFYQMVEG